eukprot:TRINITY_DN17611_c0_g1_i2.p1 TRINITY_DN17611_c0_g1~~TRINITY_DN17611_c0_g1_i2.p1  ORF type:complete len:117 (-),score=22.18 TRINITY_DN17611_c0_g1_i2:14-364(-)
MYKQRSVVGESASSFRTPETVEARLLNTCVNICRISLIPNVFEEGAMGGSVSTLLSTKTIGLLKHLRCASHARYKGCLLYTSDAADEEDSVDLGGRRLLKKKKKIEEADEVHHNKK